MVEHTQDEAHLPKSPLVDLVFAFKSERAAEIMARRRAKLAPKADD